MLYLHDAKAGSTASGKGFRVFRRPLQLQNLLGIDSPPSQLGMVGDLRLAVICSPCADERIAHGF
jgi:hypothetical protein